MSTDARSGVALLGDTESGGIDRVRAVALGGVGLLTLAYVSVFYHFIDVTGNPIGLVVVGGAALAAAVALSRTLAVERALLIGAALLTGGLALYLVSLPRWPPVVPLLTDAIALATGRSLLRIANVDLWVMAVAPAPLFLTWYFALRRRYVAASLIGGATLGFLILTGDAWAPVALLGVVGAMIGVGAGDADRRGDSLGAVEPLAVLLAAMILLSGIVSVVPAGPDRTYDPWSGLQPGGGGDAGTVEASLVDADSQMRVQGDISLSPAVRFRVQSERESYWQVGTYDRYTGDGWVRTGGTSDYDGRLDGPPGRSETVAQRYEALDDLGVVPAAWKPVSVTSDVTDDLRVTEAGGLEIDGTVEAGETVTVRSEVPDATAAELRQAGTDYPEEIESRYTALPASTPDRVAERTERLTANADNPYETALVVEQWLKENKSYSLDVERPEGNIADSFLFEMDAGYCTYFATTMVTMLRTQDIPARLAVGYTPGERVAEDEWVVRGLDAHAWVEAYFPEVGWVRFDPTPASDRESAELQRIENARANGSEAVDTNDTVGDEWTPTETPTPAPLTPRPDRNVSSSAGANVPTPGPTPPDELANLPARSGVNDTVGGPNATASTDAAAGSDGDGGGPSLPSREEASLGAIALIGVAIGLRRSGVPDRLYRAAWLRYQPRRDPRTDAERAFERLEYLLAQRHRPRRPAETPRQYLTAVGADERARTVALVRERARYAGDVTREEADRAIELVDELVAD